MRLARHAVDAWHLPELTVDRYRCAPGTPEGVETHAHDEYQLCLADGVACAYDYRGATHVVRRGGLCILHPGEPHATRDAEPRLEGATYHMLYAQPVALLRIAAELGARPASVPFVPSPVVADEAAVAPFRAFLAAVEGGVDALRRDELGVAMLAHLVARHGEHPLSLRPPIPARPEIERARQFLHDHPDRGVALADLAHAAGLSPYHLCRLFKREFGFPPHAYHLRLRVARAKRLLADGLTPDQAAFATGFYDQSQFGRHFRRFVGTTPGRYGIGARNA